MPREHPLDKMEKAQTNPDSQTGKLCECSNLARCGKEAAFFTEHHPNCRQYNPHGDAAKVIKALLKGMRDWAADEDGVHPDACDAYDQAAMRVWEKPLKDEDKED